MDVIERINEQMELLKHLEFNLIITNQFSNMLKGNYMCNSCYTHNIHYPPYTHLSYCYIWKWDGKYKFVIRINPEGVPEETIKKLELLGYSFNKDALVYEGAEDDNSTNRESAE